MAPPRATAHASSSIECQLADVRARISGRHRMMIEAARRRAEATTPGRTEGATLRRVARHPAQRFARSPRGAAPGRGRDHGAELLPLAPRRRLRPAGVGAAAAPAPRRALGRARRCRQLFAHVGGGAAAGGGGAHDAPELRRPHLAALLRVARGAVAREALRVGADAQRRARGARGGAAGRGGAPAVALCVARRQPRPLAVLVRLVLALPPRRARRPHGRARVRVDHPARADCARGQFDRPRRRHGDGVGVCKVGFAGSIPLYALFFFEVHINTRVV